MLSLLYIIRNVLSAVSVFSAHEKKLEAEFWPDVRPISAALRMQVRRPLLVPVIITASKEI